MMRGEVTYRCHRSKSQDESVGELHFECNFLIDSNICKMLVGGLSNEVRDRSTFKGLL